MIPAEIIERVRAETDIVGLIGEYVALKRAGRSFVGLCPFHKEKTPSFNVSSERQAYHCFGCGAGGNALTFVMNYENLSFPEAVKHLAERLGIKIEYTAEDDPSKPLYDALEIALKVYKNKLWSEEGLGARQYLASRGLKEENIKTFALGLVPQDTSELLAHARELKLSTKMLSDAGVLGNHQGRFYPFLAGRIVFPIKTASGKLVGFSGRIFGEDANPAKYVNTPETKIFKKGQLLYGLFEARPYLRREGALIAEGQMDVLRLVQEGFRSAVAPLGTAFTAEHARLLSRYTESVILVFDGDEAGRKAALRTLGEALSSDLDVKLVLLPEGEDPASYLALHTRQDFEALLKEAEEPMSFLFGLYSPKSAAELRRVAEIMISVIRRIPDNLKRELYVDEAAKLIGVHRGIIAERVSSGESKKQHKPESKTSRISDTEEMLLKMMVTNSEFVAIALKHLAPSYINERDSRELLELLYKKSSERERFTPGEIMDALSEHMRQKVSEWSLSELKYSKEEFSRTLAHYIYQRTREKLRNDLREAENVGDAERAKRILSQLNSLVRESNKIYQGI